MGKGCWSTLYLATGMSQDLCELYQSILKKDRLKYISSQQLVSDVMECVIAKEITRNLPTDDVPVTYDPREMVK